MATKVPKWVVRYVAKNREALAGLGCAATRTYGCGSNGCAFPCRDRRWTVKVTADPSEVGMSQFVIGLRRRGVSVPGIVKFHGVYRGKDLVVGPRAWVIVREAVDPVPRESPPSSPVAKAIALLARASAAAADRNEAAEAGDPRGVVGATRRFRAHLTRAARLPVAAPIAKTMWRLATKEGLYLEDVRRDNVGLVDRPDGRRLVVMDPGGQLTYPRFSHFPRMVQEEFRRNPDVLEALRARRGRRGVRPSA